MEMMGVKSEAATADDAAGGGTERTRSEEVVGFGFVVEEEEDLELGSWEGLRLMTEEVEGSLVLVEGFRSTWKREERGVARSSN